MEEKDFSRVAKDYLSNIYSIDLLVNRLTDTAATLLSSLTSVNCELKPDKIQTSGAERQMEDGLIRIESLREDIRIRINELINLKAEALTLIGRLPDRNYQTLLIARYVDGHRWERIAEEMDYSIAQIYRMHGRALVEFGKMIVNDS